MTQRRGPGAINEMIASIRKFPGRDTRHYLRMKYSRETIELVKSHPDVTTVHYEPHSEGNDRPFYVDKFYPAETETK